MAQILEQQTIERTPAPLRGLTSLATALGLGAVTSAAACCVLPMALASIGLGAGFASTLAGLATVKTPLLILSGLALAVAWAMWSRKREMACAAGDACAADAQPRRPVGLLLAATALVGLAAIWGWIEPALMRWVS